MARYRLAIGTPTTGYVRIEYAESLLATQRALLNDPSLKIDDVCLLYYCSSVIPSNRHEIIDMAQQWKATHILWIDDDMRWPPGVAKALFKSMIELNRVDKENAPKIIGANCIKRKYPIEYMATDMDQQEVVSRGKKGLDEVLYTGNSFTLMDMSLFTKIEKPWFAFAWNQETGKFGTEDVFFMVKARKHGYPTYIVHELGEHIDHIGAWTFKASHGSDGRGHNDVPDWVRFGDSPVEPVQGEGGRVPE